jgi:hypothetical protein
MCVLFVALSGASHAGSALLTGGLENKVLPQKIEPLRSLFKQPLEDRNEPPFIV